MATLRRLERTVIVPDEKDWTWTIERPCEECGFDPRSHRRESTGALARHAAQTWRSVLARPGATIRARPDRWSDLEYGCHTRDVFGIFRGRLELMLAEDEPVFANWDQDETARSSDYSRQDPGQVATELADAAAAFADRYDAVSEAQWSRAGVRSNGSPFTVETLAVYCSHDVAHHLSDVGA
jgi:hypothetical protein